MGRAALRPPSPSYSLHVELVIVPVLSEVVLVHVLLQLCVRHPVGTERVCTVGVADRVQVEEQSQGVGLDRLLLRPVVLVQRRDDVGRERGLGFIASRIELVGERDDLLGLSDHEIQLRDHGHDSRDLGVDDLGDLGDFAGEGDPLTGVHVLLLNHDPLLLDTGGAVGDLGRLLEVDVADGHDGLGLDFFHLADDGLEDRVVLRLVAREQHEERGEQTAEERAAQNNREPGKQVENDVFHGNSEYPVKGVCVGTGTGASHPHGDLYEGHCPILAGLGTDLQCTGPV